MRKKALLLGSIIVLIVVNAGVSVVNSFFKAKNSNTGCGGSCAGCNACTKLSSISSTYYISKKDDLLKRFDNNQKYFKKVLKTYYQETEINNITKESRLEFEKIIPEIPYIGGDKNPRTEDLEQAAMALAFYRIQKAHGKRVEETGEIIFKATATALNSYPKWLLRFSGGKYFSKKYIEAGKRDAQESQKREFEGDWVTIFVPGNKVNFDYGCDHIECGNVKFMNKQGAAELTPYLCKLDFLYSDALGEGLVRTSTLAEGGKVCDFRFKRRR